MSMIPAKLDPIELNEILNKKPKDLVTSEEWNEIFNLLVTQGNYLSTNYTRMDKLMEDLILGKVPTVSVNYDVTLFGGKPPSDYTLDTELTTACNTLVDLINTKQNTFTSTPNRIVCTNTSGQLATTSVVTSDLQHLGGIRSNLQDQIDTKLGKNETALNALKLNDKRISVQTSQPAYPTLGDVWISW